MKLWRTLIWILLTFSLFFPTQATSTVQAATLCDQAQFIADVTIPDGTVLAAGTTFTKTWRLKNIGTCSWGSGYRLAFSSGAQMGGPAEVNLPYSVAPGQTVDVSVTLTAPSTPGTHRGYWMLKNASGVLFGLGTNADKPFWVEIVVPTAQNVVLDFFAQAANASWGNVSGSLSFPGQEGDPKGFVLPRENPTLESGVVSGKALLMVPQQVYNGVIYGVYPALTVQTGDEFQATIGCEQGATGCYARFTLQYLDANGLLYTLWSFDEKYDGAVYSARVSLRAIAGKTVRFVLKVRAAGSATGDRAVWVNPVIVRTGGLPPTATPLPGTPTPTSTLPPVSACDKAQFIADVTIPDGTLMAPGQVFDKTWRLKNIGTCTWTTAYKLVFVSGEQMGGPAEANLPREVPPGSTVDLTVRLTAPSVAGTYRGYWQFKNAAGVLFGIGTPAVKPWWVEIRVSGPTPTPTTPPSTSDTLYDFAARACEAQWVSGAGNLPCPGSEGDARGFVRVLSAPRLENGVTDSRPGLLTVPQNVYNGYIQGIYPPIRVQAGDRFESIVNCEYGATSCLVIFRLDYRIGSGPTQTLWAFGERYEGLYYRADLDLSALAGQEVRFVLTVLANGSASGDRALWVAPRIRRPAAGATSTPTPTATLPPGTPSPTATPISFVPYAVVMVNPNDVLNIRSGPGVSNPIIGSFPYNATNIIRTGRSSVVSGDTWVEVQKPDGGTGWVNFYYLTEQVDPSAFCADGRVSALVEQFRQAITASNGQALANLVSVRHGLSVHYLPYTSNVVFFAPSQIASIFTSSTVYNWGPGPGGGPDVVGTFSSAILPKLLDVLNHPQYQTFCQELRAGTLSPEGAWPARYTNFRYYTLYRPASPDSLDWRAWTLAIELVNGEPKITAMLQYQWEP